MTDTLEDRLRDVLPNMSAEDVHAVASFAEFLRKRRQNAGTNCDRQLTDDEHGRIVAALEDVARLSMERGPPVSNRDHDKYLYGGQ